MVVKDSSDITMCYYNQDMVQINEMNSNDVKVVINNVWTRDALPEQLRVFVHTNGIDAILDKKDGDGFQCLNTDGSDIDIEGDNELSIQCFQESEDAPWLAVIDVVITDEIICASNDVPHPCFPDSEPILESCSWRIVVPCEQESLCKEEATSSPSNFPTSNLSESPSSPSSFNPTTSTPTIRLTTNPTTGPTNSPSVAPTVSSTASPTAGPTHGPTPSPSGSPTSSPTFKLTRFEVPTESDDIVFPPAGPPECPEDIKVISHDGVTNLPDHTVKIVDQNSSTVTVQLVQAYTDSSSAIGSWYYQYQQNSFSNKCYGDNDVAGEDVKEITIQCYQHNQVALLEFWVTDDINSGVLTEGDNAVIPKCCHPTEPEGTPVTKYVLQIRCETMCPEAVA